MLGVDLVQAAQRRIEQKVGIPTKTEEVAEGLWVRVDSFSLLQGLTYLAFRLRDDYKIREVRFRLAAEGRLAHFDLIWSGALVGSQTLPSLGNRTYERGRRSQSAHAARGDRAPWR